MAKKKPVRKLKKPDTPIEDWEQQDKESSKAFAAFAFYRDTEPRHRSLVKCIRSMYGEPQKKVVKMWEKWSVQHSWVARVKSYERYKDREIRKLLETEHGDIRKRHLTIARSIQRAGLQALNRIEEGKLKQKEILAYLKESIAMERDATGLALSLYDDTLDVTELSDEDLKALIEDQSSR